jgi:hypothetical protein
MVKIDQQPALFAEDFLACNRIHSAPSATIWIELCNDHPCLRAQCPQRRPACSTVPKVAP